MVVIWYNKPREGDDYLITTSQKMEILLSNSGHTKKWLAEQWGISQPSITQKFKYNNWKESDIKKFCVIIGLEYEVVFIDKNGVRL